MRSFLLAAVLAASFAYSQVPSPSPAPNPRIAQVVADLQKTKTPREAALSPSGDWLAWTVDGTLHLAKTDALNADRIISPEPANRACANSYPIWSENSSQLAFLSKCDGEGAASKTAQIWMFDPASGKTRQITHLEGLISKPQFSEDGKTLVFLFVPNATREAGALDAMKPAVGVIGRDNFEVQRLASVGTQFQEFQWLTPPDQYIYEFSLAPNGGRFVYVAAPPPGENNWWVAKLFLAQMGAEDRREHKTPGRAGGCGGCINAPQVLVDPNTIQGPLHGLQIALPRFSPDGHNIAFIGGLMSDFGSTGGDLYIAKADGPDAGKDTHPFTAGRPSSITWFQWADPDHMFISERVRGKVHVAILGTNGRELPYYAHTFDGSVGSGQFSGSLSLSIAKRSMAVIRSSFEQAPEVWLGPPTNMRQVTHLNDALKPAWGKSESIEYTNGGFNIQGFLLYPAHYDPAKKYGLITYVHGGPASTNSSMWPGTGFGPAPFSAMDYFVFLPNPRGSYGQGEAFTQANRKDFGHGDLSDILAGLDVVQKRFPIDEDRVGLTGWSYGGFMTMFGVTQTDRFKAAVAGAGISNWQSYYGENSIDQWMTPYFGGTVYDDPAVYARSSAINYIKQAKTPTLIVVGDRDGECPAPQSFEFWHALRSEGVDAELVVYPNEGHGFRDPGHRIDVLSRALDWFDHKMPNKLTTAASQTRRESTTFATSK